MLLVGLNVDQARDEIGEHAGQLDLLYGDRQLGGRLRNQLERFDGAFLHLDHPRFDFWRDRFRLVRELDARDRERITVQEFHDAETLLPLADDMVRAVGRRQIAHDRRGGSDVVQFRGRRIVGRGIALEDNPDPALAPHRFLNRGDRCFAADVDRHHEPRKQHEVTRGQDDQRVIGNRRKAPLGVRARLFGDRLGGRRVRLFHLDRQVSSPSQILRNVRRRHPCSSTRSSISKRPGGKLMRRSKRP